MDVISEDQALQAVLRNYNNFDGIDNEALESEIQQLEEYINGKNNICFPDDAMSQGSHNTDRPTDNVLRNATVPIPHTQPSTCTGPGPISYQNTHASGLNPPNPAYISGPLPDSPPDSGSEPYSPPEGNQDIKSSSSGIGSSMSGHSIPSISAQVYMMTPPVHPPSSHTPAQPPPPNTSAPGPPPHAHKMYQPAHYPPGEPPKLNHLPVSSSHHMPPVSTNQLPISTQAPPASLPQINQPILPAQFTTMNNTQNHANKKRKYSDSPQGSLTPGLINSMGSVGFPIKQEPADVNGMLPDCSEDDYSYPMGPDSGSMFLDGTYQVIKWQVFQPTKWTSLLDENMKELPAPSYRVDADKGFTFSLPDDAFVCQKKNHFQVTVHIGVSGIPRYVKGPEGIQKIDSFYLHFYGIKAEANSQTINLEQSQANRSKKPFYPVKVDLPADQVTKVTVGRLHFSETTTNNMRKKGKPNPDQRYFMLVVSLQAHSGDNMSLVAAHVSERIIVRASNPGQFDNDMDIMWQKGHTPDSVFHAGRVGINTDRPDEALTVHGNMRLTGHMVQPSDKRAKTNFEELDPREQLKNVSQLKVYKYEYDKEYAETAGLSEEELEDTGVLAQEVKEVIPDAVKDTGDLELKNGDCISNFLVVNKDRIYMENVGAVKELCKLTDNLENRIDELEKMNKSLSKIKRVDSMKSNGSLRSIGSAASRRLGPPESVTSPSKSKSSKYKSSKQVDPETGLCSNRFIQITVIVLVLVMAFCLIAITTLFILERHENKHGTKSGILGQSNHGQNRTISSTGSPTHERGQHTQSNNSTPPLIMPNLHPAFDHTPPPTIRNTTDKGPSMIHSWRCIQENHGCTLQCCPGATPGVSTPRTTMGGPAVRNQGVPVREDQSTTPPPQKFKPKKGDAEDVPFEYGRSTEAGTNRDMEPIHIIPIHNGEPDDVYYEVATMATRNPRDRTVVNRQKRSVPLLSGVNITVDDNQEDIDDRFCQEPCDGSETGNYTYMVYYSGYLPLDFLHLVIRTDPDTDVHKCETSFEKDNRCPGQKELKDRNPDKHSGPHTRWSLPVLYYTESSLKFRISKSGEDHDDVCAAGSSGLKTRFLEYSLHFKRYCGHT